MSENLGERTQKGTASFYLQFGGQGTPWFRELRHYYEEPAFQTFFQTALEALEEERHRIEGSIGLAYGLDLEGWLKDPESIPSESYLSCAAVSLPLVFLTQMAHWEQLMLSLGAASKQKAFLSRCMGASGHSQGIIGAVLAALQAEGSAYYEALAKFFKYQLYIGVSAQKAHPYPEASQEECELSQSLGGGYPSPMLAVLGSDHKSIERIVEECNADLPEDKQIYVSLYNTPTNRILSSYRSSLIAFQKKYQKQLQEKQCKCVYLLTTCPFHSPLMQGIIPIFESELDYLDFRLSGQDLQLPVYSFCDGGSYQKLDSALPYRMYQDLMLHTLYWSKALEPARAQTELSHILDFGPGKTTQRLSADNLRKEEYSKAILALALPKEMRRLQEQLSCASARNGA